MRFFTFILCGSLLSGCSNFSSKPSYLDVLDKDPNFRIDLAECEKQIPKEKRDKLSSAGVKDIFLVLPTNVLLAGAGVALGAYGGQIIPPTSPEIAGEIKEIVVQCLVSRGYVQDRHKNIVGKRPEADRKRLEEEKSHLRREAERRAQEQEAARRAEEARQQQEAERRTQEKIAHLKRGAKAGDSRHQANLAWAFYKGLGVPKNYPEAFKWATKSASQGSQYAQHTLGEMYLTGSGVPKNYRKAVEWFRLCASIGDPVCEKSLGLPTLQPTLQALARKKEEARQAEKDKKAAVLAARQERYRDAVAVVIGNRKYANQVPAVEFAHNDASAMRRYLLGLGYRDGNIIFIKDATQSQMMAVFGTKDTHRGKLFSYIRPGESDLTVFYSGHGVPGLKDRRGYLLPVDADPNLVEINGFPIDLMYKNLDKLNAKTVRVYMDACFSGDSPNGMLIRAASGISVKPRMPKRRAGSNMISITAAQGDQLASWDEDAKHGLFTRHLLEALEGKADAKRYGNRDGKVTLAEVKNYLDREMTYQARRRYNRDQTAAVFGDINLVLSSYR